MSITMSKRLGYAIALAGGLAVMSVLGNMAHGDPHFLSAIPNWHTFIVFPIILAILLVHTSRLETNKAFRSLMHEGNKVVLIASSFFAIFHSIHGYFYFESRMFFPSILSLLMTFVATWITGFVFTGIISWIVYKFGSR